MTALSTATLGVLADALFLQVERRSGGALEV